MPPKKKSSKKDAEFEDTVNVSIEDVSKNVRQGAKKKQKGKGKKEDDWSDNEKSKVGLVDKNGETSDNDNTKLLKKDKKKNKNKFKGESDNEEDIAGNSKEKSEIPQSKVSKVKPKKKQKAKGKNDWSSDDETEVNILQKAVSESEDGEPQLSQIVKKVKKKSKSKNKVEVEDSEDSGSESLGSSNNEDVSLGVSSMKLTELPKISDQLEPESVLNKILSEPVSDHKSASVKTKLVSSQELEPEPEADGDEMSYIDGEERNSVASDLQGNYILSVSNKILI